MSEMFKCDGCGKTFIDDATLTEMSIRRGICPITKRPFEKFHFCPECGKKLDGLIEEMKA